MYGLHHNQLQGRRMSKKKKTDVGLASPMRTDPDVFKPVKKKKKDRSGELMELLQLMQQQKEK